MMSHPQPRKPRQAAPRRRPAKLRPEGPPRPVRDALRVHAAGGAAPPVRTCVGCGEEATQASLVRLVLTEDAEYPVAVDLVGKAFGRGAWVHPAPSCLAGAAKRGLARSFKAQVKVQPEALVAQLAVAGGRRLTGLLLAAHRSRKLAVGADAVTDAVQRGEAQLVWLAEDAAAASRLSAVGLARQADELVEWGTKAQLGAALGRAEAAIVAVLDARLASAVRTAVAIACVVRPTPGSSGAGGVQSVDESTEVR